jgi:hypothetical protein
VFAGVVPDDAMQHERGRSIREKQNASPPHEKPALHLEATVGIEPTIGVLQTPALTTWPRRHKKNGAEDEIRTRDPLLGKEVLYH